MPITMYPSNDLAVTVTLQEIDSLTGVKNPLTTGTVTAFIATSNSPTATAADPSLSVSATHLNNPAGKWLIFFDASVLTPALLSSLFSAATPYLIVEQTNGVRAYVEMSYVASRPGTLVN